MSFPIKELIPEINKIYKAYEKLWKVDVAMYEIHDARLIFPVLKESLLTDLCRGVKEIFQNEPSLLKINENCLIMGDLHGHILDLFRVLKKFGPPPKTNYVILGDLVDRGEFSLETVTLVFVLKALYPKNVYIVRGNHEFPAMFQYHGFSSQIEDMYGNHMVTYAFANAFSFLPFGALVCGKILCVHGGIGKGFTCITQLDEVTRPVVNYDFDPVISCVWSDPKVDVGEGFIESTRGIAYFFGKQALLNFLNTQGLTLLVRGHEPCDNGIKEMFDGKLITVFGASNYCNYANNKSGVLMVTKNGTVTTPTVFSPIKYIYRNSAVFSSFGGGAAPQTTVSRPTPGVNSQRSLPQLSKTGTVISGRTATAVKPSLRQTSGNPANSSRGRLSLNSSAYYSRSSGELVPRQIKSSRNKFPVREPPHSAVDNPRLNDIHPPTVEHTSPPPKRARRY